MATIPIWNKSARDYDKYVTHSKNGLLRYYIQREREYIGEVIQEAKEASGRNVTVIEVGCGTGRVAFDIMNNRKLRTSVDYIIGIDYAEEMIREANEILFRRLRTSDDQECKKIFFLLMDALEMDNYFYDGKIDFPSFRLDGELYIPNQIDLGRYNESVKVVVITLNTIGAMRPTARDEVMQNMKSAAGRSGFVVVSVFSATDFIFCAQHIYKSMLPLISATDDSDLEFDIDDKKKKYVFRTNSGYYSEWFTREALDGLMGIFKTKEPIQAVIDEKTRKEIALMDSASSAGS